MLGVNVAVLRDGKVLLTKREDYEVWCLPGGHVDAGESLARAAIREVSEETGLEVRLTRLVGLYSRPNWQPDMYHIAVFAAEIIGGELHPDPHEVIDLRFFGRDGLPDQLLLGQRRRILDAFSGAGGSLVRTEAFVWPFDRPLDRLGLYQRRDDSGLPRDEFYERTMGSQDAQGTVLEVGEE